jgi:hypothetical protein
MMMMDVIMQETDMVRTQIQLSEEQAVGLKALAHQRGVSMAQLVRQAVDHLLAETRGPDHRQRIERAKAAAGRFGSGLTDLAERHDYYLYEDPSDDDLR